MATEWLRIETRTPRHPKIIRLAACLEMQPAYAFGHIAIFWLWALEFKPSGDVSDLTPTEIATAASYTGDAELFLASLHKAMLIDPDGMIHDWSEYAGSLLNAKAEAKERNRKYQEKARFK